MNAVLAAGVAFAAAALAMPPASAQESAPPDTAPAACTRTDFETVVDQAAATLRELNIQNRPRFQEKLRQLKEKRAWSEDEFLTEAAPFVKDREIDGFDARTNELLGRISSMGDEGSSAARPDCTLYETLRSNMNLLVETQTTKWTYMFSKIDAELAK